MSYTDAWMDANVKKGTKDRPYSSFSEAMKDGREGQNVYVGDTYTKMAYAPSDASSSKPASSSSESSSGGITDVQPSFLERVFGVKNPDGSIWTSPDGDTSWNWGNIAKGVMGIANPALGIAMLGGGLMSGRGDGDGSRYITTSKDGKVTNMFGQELNMPEGRKISGFFDSLDVDGDGSWLTTGGKFFTPQTQQERDDYQKLAMQSSGGDSPAVATPTFTDPNQEGVLPDGTPKCKFGFVYDATKNACVPEGEQTTAETPATTTTTTANLSSPTMTDPNQYGFGGEQILSSNIMGAKDGMALPLGPTGVVKGRGGPKDDMVGPLALSAGEFVSPIEQIKGFDPLGEGNYRRGIAALEQHRINSLNKYG